MCLRVCVCVFVRDRERVAVQMAAVGQSRGKC